MIATEIHTPNMNMNIKVQYGNNRQLDFTLDASNAMKLQTKEMNPNARDIQVNANGSGFAVFQVTTSYNIIAEEPSRKFELRVNQVSGQNGNTLMLDICASFVKNGDQSASKMTLMEIYLPSGYVYDPETTSLVRAAGVKVKC